jgi:hypothetical protein
MFRLILRQSIAALVVVLPTVAAAQQTPSAMLKGNDTTVDTPFHETVLAAHSQTNGRSPKRDSLLNGALLGGFIGGVSGGVGTYAVEHSICSECPAEGVLIGAAVGAAIGAGIGTAIDALRDRNRAGGTPRRGPFELSPILAKGRRGIVAWVRF